MSEYDLKSLNLPRLTGRPLRLFATAMGNAASRAAILPKLLSDAGIPRLRQIQLDEPPTLRPLRPAADPAPAYAPPDLSLDDLRSAAPMPFATIHDYATAYRSGATTPTAVAEQVLDAVIASDRGNHPLRAFIASRADDVRRQAAAATERIQNGQPLSWLDGVPVAIKDELDMLPYPTTVGTQIFGKQPADADSTVVARLRAAGALLLGKANMHEIGINPTGSNPNHGQARNPYHREHDPGGSSSGPAVATAAGFCPVSVGADGGGSIRIPAALCGLVGLKATYGRISEHGAAPLCWSVAHVGPIGASVADVAYAYALMAGPDSADANTAVQPTVSLPNWRNADLSGIRLGVYRDWFNHATPDIVAANQAMLDQLVQLGAEIVEITVPDLDLIRIAHAVTILSEMNASMINLSVDYGRFTPPTRINLQLANAMGSLEYVQAQRIRTRAMDQFDAILADVDGIVTPATAVTAPPVDPASLTDGISDLSTVTELMRFIVASNLTGHPAIAFPVGYNAADLPIGMQIIGRHWDEALLLRLAFAAETVVERQRPSSYYDLLDATA